MLRKKLISKLMNDAGRLLNNARRARDNGNLSLSLSLSNAGLAKLARAHKLAQYA